ncbi:TetR/AcrR family transcriptional regulator [Cohnella endophytica]|uniref:TetR/AcrR family transcriptional regulator n=1 Tax=Cohnella endophytica TaxID=2419778 RepID=A0A494XLL5_9BACL|nr:TetR/AcrR family transcriptional regulator [Cohnella endophytica]RKP51587.1 TetR/AcrR family transcriptional regulator [Cohnella endophytica]
MYTNKQEGKTDLRVRRTRKLLWEALLDLLESRAFESLSVQEVCDRAMVHRTTFYKHFEDKHHLLYFGLEATNELFKNRSYEDRILHPMKLIQSWGHTKQFQTLVKAATENSFISNMMMKHGAESLRQDLLQAQKDGVNFKVPVDIVAAFYSGALSSLCAWWMKDGMMHSPEEMDNYLSQMINRNLFFPE